MREFKIRKIDNDFARFTVEIEFKDNGDRQNFCYPIGDGWDIIIDGKPRFIHDIIMQISEEAEDIISFSLEKLKKFEGIKISDKDLKKKPEKHQIDENSCKKG